MKFLSIKEELNYSKRKYKTMRKIEDVFLNHKYQQIEPTLFEDYDVIKDLGKKESFVKVIDANDVKVLRPDITTNIMRNIVPKIENGDEYKLFYDASIFKSNSKGKVKTAREMGVENIGFTNDDTETETVLLALEILEKFTSDFIMELGNSRFVELLLNGLSQENAKNIKGLLKEKNKSILNDYLEDVEMDEDKKSILKNIFRLEGSIEEINEVVTGLNLSEDLIEVVEALNRIASAIKAKGYPRRVQFDLSMIAEWNYYDGLIFQAYVKGAYTEIVKGGRYDSLTLKFGKELPAIGFVIDLDKLVSLSEV